MKYVYWVIGWLIIGIITAATEGYRVRKKDKGGEDYKTAELGAMGLFWPLVWVCWGAVSICRGYGWVIEKVTQLVGSDLLRGLKNRLANTLKSE